jgi:tetratricopeptide (TPR) repeat protein
MKRHRLKLQRSKWHHSKSRLPKWRTSKWHSAARRISVPVLVLSLFLLPVLLPGVAPVLAQETAEELYQAGLYQEEVQGNLSQAIGLFERIVSEFPSNRAMAANALMHIGLCHEKLGSQEAQRAYQRLIRECAGVLRSGPPGGGGGSWGVCCGGIGPTLTSPSGSPT